MHLLRPFFVLLAALGIPGSAGAQVTPPPVQSATVTALGSTAPRSLAARFADTINVLDFGAKCDGSTDDTAAFRAALALTSPTTIRIPTGTCRISGAALTAASAVSLVGDGRGVSIIQLAPGAATSGAVFSWSGYSNVTISNLTLDLNGASASPTVLTGAISITGGSGHDIEDVAVINGGSSYWLLLALDGVSDTTIQDNLLALAAAHTTQNQGINVSCAYSASNNVHITGNVLVSTGIETCIDGGEISGNDISGFAFGTGIATEASPFATNIAITNNRIYDGATTTDSNDTASGGVENWAPNCVISNNLIWGNGGVGIDQGGQNCSVIGNVTWGNGRRTDGGGGSGIDIRYANSTYNGNGSLVAGNISFGNGNASGAGRGYGYNEQSSSLTGIVFGINSWAGPQGATSILGTPAISSMPAGLAVAGNETVGGTITASGTNSLVMAGSSGWPTITSGAGVVVNLTGANVGLYATNQAAENYVSIIPAATGGADNPATQAGDNLLSFSAGSPGTGVLTIAPYSGPVTPYLRMTTTLTTLGNAVALTPTTPAGSSAACTAGQIAVDANYVYVCTAPNAWKRAALASW
jgi:hypothetical protein